MIGDKHLHTRFSTDSSADPEEVINRAVELGMKEICITDHYDIDFPEPGKFVINPEEYFEFYTKMKEKYKGRIDVHIGLEAGIGIKTGEKVNAVIANYPWEYVIGSVHFADGKDLFLRDSFKMDDSGYYRLYFETMLGAVKACDGFNTLGHIDYAARYGYEKDKYYIYEEYAELIDGILKEIIGRGIALEVNTAALRNNMKHFHPYPEVLTRYRQLGGRKLSIGSDAHRVEQVGYKFKEALRYAEDFGFAEGDFI